MATLSSPGIGSGLDINGLVKKLMQVEQRPIAQLNSKEASFQAKISAFGALQGAVSSFNGTLSALALSGSQTAASKFISYRASVGESSVGSAVARANSIPGSHMLEVNQLAKAHRISTIARAHTLVTPDGVYNSANDAIATGTLALKVGTTTTNITIDSSSATLGGLRDAINLANAGVTAEIVTSPNGVQLKLTSGTAGIAGEMDLSGLAGFTFDATTHSGDFSQDEADGGQAAFGGYSSANASIAQGTLVLGVGANSYSITIDSSNDTLAGLRDAINASSAGVSATLVTVSANDVRLVLSSSKTGLAGRISLSGLPGFSFDPLSNSGDLSQAAADGGQAAQQAIIKFNGLTVTNNSNTFANVVDGVDLTVSKTTSSATTLSITHDKSSTMSSALTAMVKAYNELNKVMRDLGAYDAETKQGGPLLGNATLRTISSSIRNTLQAAFSTTGAAKRLSDLGVEMQKDGSLTFSTSKLSAAVNADFDAVATVVTGFGNAAKTLTDGMLDKKGGLAAASDSAKASISAIDKQREVLGRRLEQVEARYRRQFNALDTLLANMNSTSAYLQQQLAGLSSLNNRNN